MLDLGDIYQVAVTIRDTDGNPVNPATANLTITLPDGTSDTPAVTLPPAEVGVLRVDHTTAQFGLHRWRLTTTGPTTAFADAFSVVDSTWPALVGLAEVKKHLNYTDPNDTTDDEELRGFLLSAGAVVEDVVGAVATRTVIETANGGERHFVTEKSPVQSVTEIRADGELVDPGDYTFSPSGLVARRSGCWPAGLRNLQVTYVPGRAAVPPNVRDATLELIRINWRPQQGGNYSSFDGGRGDDFGQGALEASLQGNLRLGFFVPNTVSQRLQPDRRGPVVL